MSYLSSKDMDVLQPSIAPRAMSTKTFSIPGASPVGPTLEAVLLLATSAAVSLVFCTALAGALIY